MSRYPFRRTVNISCEINGTPEKIRELASDISSHMKLTHEQKVEVNKSLSTEDLVSLVKSFENNFGRYVNVIIPEHMEHLF